MPMDNYEKLEFRLYMGDMDFGLAEASEHRRAYRDAFTYYQSAKNLTKKQGSVQLLLKTMPNIAMQNLALQFAITKYQKICHIIMRLSLTNQVLNKKTIISNIQNKEF